MSFTLPIALQDMPFADAYLEALGKQYQVPLLGFGKRLENWLQHICLQQAAAQPLDTARAVSFAFELPDNLPVAVSINAVRHEAALVALWQQQGLAENAPVPLLLPMLSAAWWRVAVAPEEEGIETPWQQLLHTLVLLRQHTHHLDGLRLLLVALFQLNEAMQQYGEQALTLSLPPYPEWKRLRQAVQQQALAEDISPQGEVLPMRSGLVPAWLEGDWQHMLERYGFLPNIPPASGAVKNQHKRLPLQACFHALVALYEKAPAQGMPPLCLLGARLAMEWRAQAIQFQNKGNE